MRKVWVIAAAVLLPATGGCVAKTAWNVATLPVRAVGSGVDALTTSPKERDEKYVREMRKADEREAKERRDYEKACGKRDGYCGPYTGFRARAYRD